MTAQYISFRDLVRTKMSWILWPVRYFNRRQKEAFANRTELFFFFEGMAVAVFVLVGGTVAYKGELFTYVVMTFVHLFAIAALAVSLWFASVLTCGWAQTKFWYSDGTWKHHIKWTVLLALAVTGMYGFRLLR